MAGISPEANEDTYELQCFPLYSLLMATAGNVTVNYLRGVFNKKKKTLGIFQLLIFDIFSKKQYFHPFRAQTFFKHTP